MEPAEFRRAQSQIGTKFQVKKKRQRIFLKQLESWIPAKRMKRRSTRCQKAEPSWRHQRCDEMRIRNGLQVKKECERLTASIEALKNDIKELGQRKLNEATFGCMQLPMRKGR